MTARIEPSQIVAPVVYLAVVFVFALFAHSGLSGEHGLGALGQAETLERALRADLEDVRAERVALENKVRRLDEGHLDLDLLDERARAVLGRVRPNEIVIR